MPLMFPGCLQEVRDQQKDLLAGRNKFINDFIKKVWNRYENKPAKIRNEVL